MFTSYPVYPKYRALKLKSPQFKGEDVYALQTALLYLGYKLPQFGADGYFGQESDTAVRKFQTNNSIKVDGIAGNQTQRQLAVKITQGVAVDTGVPYPRLYGQEEHESTFWLGIYSALYANDTFDAGVTQRNTGLTPIKDGFTVQPSILALAQRVKEHYDHFEGLPTDRRWDLAQGSWNRPAHACYIAYEEGAKNSWVAARKSKTLTDAQRQWIETYVTNVSVYA
jgi:hypothetical protein